MVKIILCFTESISISQPGFMHAEPACRRGEGDAVSPSARRHDRKCFAAMHVVGKEFSYCSCLLPWLSVGSCVHSHTLTAWDTESCPWKSSRSVSHPPGSPQVTLHFLLARPLARSSLEAQLPWVHQLGLEIFSEFFKWRTYLTPCLKIICPSAGIQGRTNQFTCKFDLNFKMQVVRSGEVFLIYGHYPLCFSCR